MAGDFVLAYVATLRERAEDREREGSPLAAVYARVADELEAARAAHLQADLPLAVAAAESGYAADALRRLRKAGQWSGTRADLPRRPLEKAQPPAGVLSIDRGARPSLADEIITRQARGRAS